MRTFLLCIIFLVAQNGKAQKNTIFLEQMGNGGIGSLNYERQLTNQPGLSLRMGIGVSVIEPEEEECTEWCVLADLPDFDLSIPFSLQYLIDLNQNNYLETGLGYTFQFGNSDYSEKDTNVYFASLGFRRHFGGVKKWMWKANFTPVLAIITSENKDTGFKPWVGISFGRRF